MTLDVTITHTGNDHYVANIEVTGKGSDETIILKPHESTDVCIWDGVAIQITEGENPEKKARDEAIDYLRDLLTTYRANADEILNAPTADKESVEVIEAEHMVNDMNAAIKALNKLQ